MSNRPSTSASQTPICLKRSAAMVFEDEKAKQSKLKSEILYLQKRNLILKNKKLELEIDILKKNA